MCNDLKKGDHTSLPLRPLPDGHERSAVCLVSFEFMNIFEYLNMENHELKVTCSHTHTFSFYTHTHTHKHYSRAFNSQQYSGQCLAQCHTPTVSLVSQESCGSGQSSVCFCVHDRGSYDVCHCVRFPGGLFDVYTAKIKFRPKICLLLSAVDSS